MIRWWCDCGDYKIERSGARGCQVGGCGMVCLNAEVLGNSVNLNFISRMGTEQVVAGVQALAKIIGVVGEPRPRR